MLGTLVFAFVPALVVALALTLALKWSSDLENRRLELIFSTPQSRPRVLLERFGANVLIVLLAPVVTWLALTFDTVGKPLTPSFKVCARIRN
jgi:ABC-type transport system involved in multi-copper enzyme maturation permease subunit